MFSQAQFAPTVPVHPVTMAALMTSGLAMTKLLQLKSQVWQEMETEMVLMIMTATVVIMVIHSITNFLVHRIFQ